MLLKAKNSVEQKCAKLVVSGSGHVGGHRIDKAPIVTEKQIKVLQGNKKIMESIAIVTLLALAQYILFGIQVGSMRGKHGVKAPAVSGHVQFERMFRIQQNTMEQLVVFIPTLWIFGHFVNPLWGAGMGVVFIIGRFIYRAAYLKDPAGRGMGFTLTFLPTAIMLVWGFVAALWALFG
jgi:uncharacterized MAPEG superfamily protein